MTSAEIDRVLDEMHVAELRADEGMWMDSPDEVRLGDSTTAEISSLTMAAARRRFATFAANMRALLADLDAALVDPFAPGAAEVLRRAVSLDANCRIMGLGGVDWLEVEGAFWRLRSAGEEIIASRNGGEGP